MNKMNKMNNRIIICFILLFFTAAVQAQVTVGSGNPPAKGAILDVKQNESTTGGATSTKGFIFPRVSLDSLSSLTPLLSAADASDATQKTIHKGTIIYNVNVSSAKNLTEGLYCWDATKWVKILAGTGGNAWSTSGNSGTNPPANFVGTTDNQPLAFKVNNTPAGYISNTATGINSLGLNALGANTTGMFNTAVGANALAANTDGTLNTAVGTTALSKNQSGGNNTAVGALALSQNTASNNTAIGTSSLTTNTTGQFNTAVGESALQANTAGNSNTAIGRSALGHNVTGVQNTVVGNAALANNDGSNNTVLGYNAGKTLTSGTNNILIGQNTDVATAGATDRLNIGNAIFGSGMTGTPSEPAGNIGILVPAPARPLHVKTNSSGTLTPARVEGLPQLDQANAASPVVIDTNGDLWIGQGSSGGQIARYALFGVTFNNGSEKPFEFRGTTDPPNAPNGAPNASSTIQGSFVVGQANVGAGSGSTSRTTDRVLLMPGTYMVTLRVCGAFTGSNNGNTLFIKCIVNNNEYSLNNNSNSSDQSCTFYYQDYITILPTSTSGEFIDFTGQAGGNDFKVAPSVSMGSGKSVRSMLLIQRLR
jgi:hypothetical protein